MIIVLISKDNELQSSHTDSHYSCDSNSIDYGALSLNSTSKNFLLKLRFVFNSKLSGN